MIPYISQLLAQLYYIIHRIATYFFICFVLFSNQPVSVSLSELDVHSKFPNKKPHPKYGCGFCIN